MKRKNERQLYAIVFVGLMAAMVYVTTTFLKIEIPTPSGPTMLKVGNIVCLLAALLFGGLYGGLSAGIGSMLFDLLDPRYAAESPFTFIRFFLMAYLCGVIAHAGGREGRNTSYNIIGAVVGSVFSWVFYIAKNTIELMLLGDSFWIALTTNATKMVTSGVNAILAVVFSVILAKPLLTALDKSGMLQKLKR